MRLPNFAGSETSRLARCAGLLAVVGWVCLSVAGCRTLISVVDRNEAFKQAWDGPWTVKPERMTEETWTVLRYWDLDKDYLEDSPGTVREAKRLFRDLPDREWACALAELCYWEGDRLVGEASKNGTNPPKQGGTTAAKETKRMGEVEECFLDSVSYAYYFLFADGKPINEFDRRVATACRFYNAGLERCLALAYEDGRFNPQQALRIETTHGEQVSEIDFKGFVWHANEFNEIHFASHLRRMQNAPPHPHRSFGLGVPLIAVRHRNEDGDERERFLVKRHPFASTAFFRPDLSRLTPYAPQETLIQVSAEEPELLRPELSGKNGRLELYDPLRVTSLRMSGMAVPLEADLSAPMMFALGHTNQKKFEWGGFFDPSWISEYSGLYMIEPFQPGKIPVVCVHGLLSGPLTWTGLFEELWSDPKLRDRYQFAFFLYPTGGPFLESAKRLRGEIEEFTQLHGNDDATRHMVLVGHSMGGLLSKLQISSSDDRLWELVSRKPIDDLQTDATTREELERAFFFKPESSVQRVIFIATPHRGSELSDAPLGRFGSWLVHEPKSTRTIQRQLLKDNPESFTPLFMAGVPNSVDLLSYNNPILQVMYELPLEKRVHLHSIIGTRNENVIGTGRVAKFLTAESDGEGDGVVPLESARLAGVESEVFVPSSHDKVHRHPLTYHEISRILHEHLYAIDPPAKIRPIETESGEGPLERGKIELNLESEGLPAAGEVRLGGE